MKRLTSSMLLAFVCALLAPAALAQTQREMNEEAAKYFQDADKKLNAAYSAVIASFGEDEGQKEALREAQRAWLKFTELHLKAVFYVPEGEDARTYFGSIHAMNYAFEKGDLYQQRAVLLNKMIGLNEEDGSLNIVPGQSIGALKSGSTIDDFMMFYGVENIKEVEVPMGEGETVKGYALFPNDPEREVTIIFSEDQKELKVLITSETSRWTILDDIKIGTTLVDLEKLNHSEFKLYGFEWDFGGVVNSYGDGKLEKYRSNLTVIFDPTVFDEKTQKVLGDNEYKSSNQSMIHAKPVIREIWVSM
ncbi:lysozyme inhibitor LprI family protein [Rubritalea marina]|uniref:lysozyme inhibitor LprI family protein n=1 Tax=Rubritalea marina TaxID=361055 RepID=UPI0009FF3892|nr:lysozyme inhibitor LprI family protein [Rubritalea marina]